MNGKISIILPVFNVEDYLPRAMESMINQTFGFENLEVIFVNDCSNDCSGKIIDEYDRIYDNCISIHLDENSGYAGKPRNIGLDLATSEYVMFMDPDDYYAEGACETLYAKIIKNNLDIVFGGYSKYYDGKELKVGTGYSEEIIIDSINENPNLLKIPASIPSKIFKKSFINKNKLRFKEDIPAQDLVFVIDSFFKANGIGFLSNEIIYYYKSNRKTSVSNDITVKYLNGLLNVYETVYILNKEYGGAKNTNIYFIANYHSLHLFRKIFESKLSAEEVRNILSKSQNLFINLKLQGINDFSGYWEIPINFICEGKYNEAYISIKSMKNIIDQNKRHLEIIYEKNKIIKDKNKTIKMRTKEIANLKSTKGWLKYKFENIYYRIK